MLWPFPGLNPGQYRVIVADPPWSYSVFSEKGRGRSADRHYDTMSLDDICALPVDTLAHADCHLFLWATGPCLPHALQVIQDWGFRYSALGFVWVKLNKRAPVMFWDAPSFFMGMGHTTRQNAELVLLGRKGSPKRKSKAIRQLLFAPRGRHSEKPEELQDRIERYADGPYCELFARRTRPGWDCWGNEVEAAP